MGPNYLARSRLAWASMAMILLGLGLHGVAGLVDLPIWVVPAGYFVALAGAMLMFFGWVRWRAIHPPQG
ncbi:hypothetical protein [Jannaschia ovalis]|uniref:Uncharacterized protein n=1 Tax=Jannaschia ovalis TaxID=3038773 RepID=A0ABY8LA49_9RHOB|nr:hypothetical protein [Jannaschia sp. GRR-S6-38]WGH78219.1 hypothetical protein P8627_14465 [Jannaschia sp. GRR-S6-38]